jgi:hypothetical protein
MKIHGPEKLIDTNNFKKRNFQLAKAWKVAVFKDEIV